MRPANIAAFKANPHATRLVGGTQWLLQTADLPEDELDRVVSDPRRPTAGEEVQALEDET